MRKPFGIIMDRATRSIMEPPPGHINELIHVPFMLQTALPSDNALRTWFSKKYKVKVPFSDQTCPPPLDESYGETYVKTSVPQPAVSVKRRGPRSRAGFIAAPQFPDMDIEIPRTITATMGGISCEGAGVFLCSSKPRMHSISMPVPTT